MFIVKDDGEKTQADIRIIGVGGAGNNMIETMIQEGIKGVEFIAVNTDHQALASSSAKRKIQIGSKLTKGLGAGANPEVGRRASVESYEEIVNCLKGADMVFVTAGMGGGTGTGSAPFIAQSAHELGILTVGIVTQPFLFEGHKRIKQAKRGVSELSQYVDTLIVVPNEKLLSLAEKNTPLLETFKLTDEVLLQAVKGISELVSVPGLINLDFADIKTVMRDKGMALMGRGSASGSERVEKALKSAVSSPLLEGLSIEGATGIIVNVTADSSLSLSEFKQASSFITKMADPSADIIVGTVIDEEMKDQLSITVIAAGFTDERANLSQELSAYSKGLKTSPEQPKRSNEKWQAKQESAFTSEENLEDSISKEEKETFTENSKQIENSANEKDFFEEKKSRENLEPAFHSMSENNPNPSPDLNEGIMNENVEPDLNSSKELHSENNSSKAYELENQATLKKPHSESFQSILENKKQSLKEILLSKSKEHQKNQESKEENQNVFQNEKQIDMNLKEEHEELSSPFEAEVDFSDQDLS